jgi:hypothetical protein
MVKSDLVNLNYKIICNFIDPGILFGDSDGLRIDIEAYNLIAVMARMPVPVPASSSLPPRQNFSSISRQPRVVS